METSNFLQINGHKIASVFHDSGSKKLVIFCHGFRSSNIGPNRFFVRMARLLEKEGISSVRFDQYGSGNSEGDFMDSSFNDWITTTKMLVEKYLQEGYKISLLGQSMGGATVLVVASELQEKLASVVAWVPDASVDELHIDGPYMEEGGQRVNWNFWTEAHNAKIPNRFASTSIPEYVFLATNDQFVSEENRNALISVAKHHQNIELLTNETHSSWSYDVSTDVINKSIAFIQKHF